MFKHSSRLAVLCVSFLIGCDASTVAPTPDRASALATAVGASGLPSSAVVTFGRNDLGTDFFPPGSHDGSFHAKDAIRPRTIVIAAGGTVTFRIAQFHKIAIYRPGVTPDDIDVTSLEFPVPGFPPIIDSSAGRIVRGSLMFGPTVDWDWTFPQAGRYLVICEVLPHFVDSGMYAWIEVK